MRQGWSVNGLDAWLGSRPYCRSRPGHRGCLELAIVRFRGASPCRPDVERARVRGRAAGVVATGGGMATDLTIGLADRPGTMAEATAALARAGINIRGACGYVCDDLGVFHILVEDAEGARRALIDANFEIRAERLVVLA